MYNLFTQKHTECKEKITALLALITIKASKHLNSFKINIMEKSKAFELIEFVWNNEKTDSYLRVNIAMYEAVKLAVDGYFIIGGTDYSADRLNEFIKKLDS